MIFPTSCVQACFHPHLPHAQVFDLSEPSSEAHLGMLRQARLRMSDAVHEVLLLSAQLYAQCLESYQVNRGESMGERSAGLEVLAALCVCRNNC